MGVRSLGAWEPGSLGAWEPGSLGAWEPGSLGAWEHGSLGAWELARRGLRAGEDACCSVRKLAFIRIAFKTIYVCDQTKRV